MGSVCALEDTGILVSFFLPLFVLRQEENGFPSPHACAMMDALC